MKDIKKEFFDTLKVFAKLRDFIPNNPNISKMEMMFLNTILEIEKENKESKITVNQIKECTEVSASAVSQALNTLENKNIIKREIVKHDRRSVYVAFTEEGRLMIEEHRGMLNNALQKIVTEYGLENFENLVDKLKEFSNAIDRVREKGVGKC